MCSVHLGNLNSYARVRTFHRAVKVVATWRILLSSSSSSSLLLLLPPPPPLSSSLRCAEESLKVAKIPEFRHSRCLAYLQNSPVYHYARPQKRTKLRYVVVPPRCTGDLRFSGMLRSVCWYLFTDVSGQSINPILKGRIV